MSSRFQPPLPAAWDRADAATRRADDPFDPSSGLDDEVDDFERRPSSERPLSREEIDQLIERVLEEELERLRDSDAPAN